MLEVGWISEEVPHNHPPVDSGIAEHSEEHHIHYSDTQVEEHHTLDFPSAVLAVEAAPHTCQPEVSDPVHPFEVEGAE